MPALFRRENTVTTKFISRRAALAGVTALVPVAPASSLPAASCVDPFLVALAEYRKLDAEWDVALKRGDNGGEQGTKVWAARLAAVKTTPTTDEGWAALLEFLAADPYGPYPDGSQYPLCARAGECGEWQDAICGALQSAAGMFHSRT
jgi:hypothetical protein